MAGSLLFGARYFPVEPGAELFLVPGFLDASEREALLAESARYAWERQPVMGVPTLRSNAWFADDASAVYEYSGQRWGPAPLTKLQSALRDRLENVLGERPNAVLASLYPHGGAAVGYHADDEPLFGDRPTIASLSAGAPRNFQITRSRQGRVLEAELEIPLEDGDLLVMRGTFQSRYRHALKKAARSVGPRLNLSYRRVVTRATQPDSTQPMPASRA